MEGGSGRGVVAALDAAIRARVVRPGVDLAEAESFVGCAGRFRDTLKPVVGDEGDEASPQRYVLSN